MLTQIGTRAAPSQVSSETAVGFLLACHDRLRRFTRIAADIARAELGGPDDDVRESAQAVARFFHVAAPLHVADEEESMLPRLRRVATPALLAALQAMHDEHPAIERTIASLAAECAAIAVEPAELTSRRGRVAELSAALHAHWVQHLPAEEQVIFPAINELLSPQEQGLMLDELRARRAAASTPPR